MQLYSFFRSSIATLAVAVALAACESSSLDSNIATTSAPDASTVTATIIVTNDQAAVDWNLTSTTSVDRWRLYQNELRVCSGEPEVVTGSDSASSYLSGSCTVTLQEGNNIFYVQLCNINSSGDSICADSSAETIDYQPEEQPGAIYLQDIPSTTIDNQLYLSWVKESGANGDYWNIYRNNALVCSDILVYIDDFIAQSGGCDVILNSGVNEFQAELCLAKPVGIDDICTYSVAISTTFSEDPARTLATPVLIDPEETLPAEYNTSISWTKDTSSGSAGETWSLSNNGITVCEGNISSADTGASCGVDLREGDNLLQVRLCTDVETYSGNSCESSILITVEAFDTSPLTPGTILITDSLLEVTYEQSLELEWQITSGNGVSSWSVDLNGAQYCSTSSSDTYYTSGTCQLSLELGANAISVTGCNYGYEDLETCTTSNDVSSERLPLPGTPEITSTFPATTYDSEQNLSWERSEGGSAEQWSAIVNDISQCAAELEAADVQSGSCIISLDSGANSFLVRLCVTDSLGASICSDSESKSIELLAPMPATPVIDTPAQAISASSIEIEWSKSSGENGSYWHLESNGAAVAACADQPLLTTGSNQSGSCDLPIVSGANVVSVHLCNDNDLNTSSCATSESVTIERDILDPEFTSASSVSVAENNTSVFYTVTATDADSSAELLSFSISGADSSFFSFDDTSGDLAFVTAADYEQPQGSSGNVYAVTFKVEDEFNLSDELQLSIEVLNLNDNSPQFISTELNLTVTENDTSVIHTSQASDADGDSLAYSLLGVDAAIFSIDAASGALAFLSAPDYETPLDADSDNTYELQIQASDGVNSALQTFTVQVLGSDDESPQLASAEKAYLNISEVSLDSVIYTASASDPDSSDQFAYSLSGIDAAHFYLDATSGDLSFTTLPSIASPQDADGDNIYELEITISDAAANISTSAFSVAVADDVGFPPELDGAESLSIDFAEHSTVLVYDANATDPDGQTVTYSLEGADASLFDLDSANGELSFRNVPDFEAPFASSSANVYAVEIVASDSILEDRQTLTVTVQNINEAPYFPENSATSFSLSENDASSIDLAAALDPDGAEVSLVYTLPADVGNAHDYQYFDLLTGPAIAFVDPAGANYESPQDSNSDGVYEFTLRASDGSLSADLALTVTIVNVNESPEFTDGASLSFQFAEDNSDIVYTASASDPDAQDAIVYSIAGTDADAFSFDGTTGELRFDPPADFEFPEDADQDNTYELTVTVSDGALESQQSLAITVTNINEAPYFPQSSPTNLSLSENNSSTLALSAALDPDGANVNIVYSLPTDAGNSHDYQYFDLLTGPAIAFAHSSGANYESPQDNNNDSVYEFVLRASDGSLSADLTLTVAITNVDEAPIFTDGDFLTTEFEEGSSDVVHVANSAEDPDQTDTISYSIAGVDADDFSFSASSGELSFDPSPDFEYPTDADQDNIYHIEIIASDSSQSAIQELFVKVTDKLDTVPGPPTGIEIYGGDSEVRILWNAQEAVDSYTIFQHTDPDQLSPSTYLASYENLTSGDVTITGLVNGFTYYFIIAGTNFFGLGAPNDPPVAASVRLALSACPYPSSAAATKGDTSASGSLDCSCTSSSASGTTVNAWLGMDSTVTYSCSGSERTISSNSVPDHATGIFPNADNPNAIAEVAASYSHPLQPAFTSDEDVAIRVPGVVRNGVKLEPETGETTTGGGNSQWRYEAINGGVLELGLDDSFAHVQPDGSYHYHGLPIGHMDLSGVNDGNSMVLVGWAADGFPIYGRYGYVDPLSASSGIKVMEGSYELLDLVYLEGQGRPSSDSSRSLASLPLGTFVEDWTYASGTGDLDACNGRYGVTPHFPDGIYHYYVTDDYPYIQRCLKGSQELEFTSASVAEVYENAASLYQAIATDNLGSSVTYSLNTVNASDNSLFSINSSSGVLSFADNAFPDNVTFGMATSIADYENLPTGPLGKDPYTTPYIIEIEAQDDAGGAASIQVQLTILDANESPYFTQGETDTYFNGNAGAIDLRIANELLQEADGDDIPMYAGFSPRPYFVDHEDQLVNSNKPLHDAELNGTDANYFHIKSINSAGDVEIWSNKTPDDDNPEDADGDHVYEFSVVGIDSVGNRTEQPLKVGIWHHNDEHPYLISSSQSARSDSANNGRLYFEANLSAYSTAVFFTAEAYDEDLSAANLLPNQQQLYFELSGESADEQFFELDYESGELRASKSLSSATPEDADGDGVYELQIIVFDYAHDDTSDALDNTFYAEDVKPRWLYVTVEAAANEATPSVASGPQIPWFYSDVTPGSSIRIPWVIYSGSSATSWELFVDGVSQCSGLGGDTSNDVVDRGYCEVPGSALSAGKFDHSTYVEVCYADNTCATSDTIVFGYAASDAISFPQPTSGGDADDCKNVDIGDPVNSSENSACYNYLLGDDDFGGPHDQVPAYLSSTYGRSFDVIAYYTEWGIYARDVQPADMPVNLLSSALYSFIQFEDDNKSSECEECIITGAVDLADYYAALQKTYPTDQYIGTEGIDASAGSGIGSHWTIDSGYKGNGIFKQFWLLKQKFPHFKTCLSVGGWTFSRPFPLVASDSVKRQTFVESIVDMAVKYHFDCIDIDWEFPGRAGGDNVVTDPETGLATYNLDLDDNATFLDPSTENDPRYFELLIAALYDEIKSRVESYHIEINSAVFTSSDGMAIMDYGAFSGDLSGIHMMTYDYYGAWDPFTGYQAALYHNTDPVGSDAAIAGYGGLYNPEHNIASAMVRGVNNGMNNNFSGTNYEMRRKVVPGLAFYGRNYSEVGAAAGGDDPVPGKHMVRSFGSAADKGNTAQISWEAGNINYIQLKGYYEDGDAVEGNEDYNATPEMVVGQDQNGNDIKEVLTFNTADYNWTYRWDDEAKAPFLFDADGLSADGFPTGSFITYTDPRAIYYQTCHAAWENSKGVMFWEITQDSTDFQLVDAIHAAIKGEDLANRGYQTAPSCYDITNSEHYVGGSTHVGDSDEPGIVGLVEMGYINEEIFNNLFPYANGDASTTEQTYTWDGFYEAAQEFAEDGFLDVGSVEDRVRELAAFLANTSHETGISSGGYELNNIGGDTAGSTRYDGGYYYQQEQYCTVGEGTGNSVACGYCLYGAGYDFACDWINGVDQEPAHYSNYYYGRGALQLSWNYNYGQFSEYYYGDDYLLGDPNDIIRESDAAFASAVWFWMTVQDPKPSMHQVMTDPDYDGDYEGHAPGFGMTINILNGGLECGQAFAYDKVRNRVGFYLTYLNAFSAFHGSGISPWVNGYGSTPATSLDFPIDDEHLIDDDYPDARDYLSCSQMINYNDI